MRESERTLVFLVTRGVDVELGALFGKVRKLIQLPTLSMKNI